MIPTALPTCHNASSITGDAHRAIAHVRCRRRGAVREPAGSTGAEACTAEVVTIGSPGDTWVADNGHATTDELDASTDPRNPRPIG
ncbi:hypothetical protein MAIC_25940 [Mycolicibacterium aichiense]|uniref:Uncharacterized protein n=1 Tax=Mycolicibacterium aichiense TaxID=1799 RepID=A0AAD1HQM4_9MYCO|nr:hypothetical protein MAIC_25940 [Mycolicibacterium aichiense]